MVAILTSSLGGSYKVNGKRIPTCLQNENGLLDQIKKYWKPMSKVLIISAGPNDFIRNDNILFCQREAFVMSGLDAKFFDICDARMTDFGAFVELAPGVDALLHVSQISREHVEKPSDVLSVGQEITAKIVDLNEEEKKISLSMKALEADRDEEDAVSVDYEADAE